MKNTIPGRTISFQPTPEVRAMLQQAKDAGICLTPVINASLQAHATVLREEALAKAQQALKSAQAYLDAHKP